jgi:transcriptional regulator with XRE-family HTH domain
MDCTLSLSEKLKDLRVEAGLSLKELSAALGGEPSASSLGEWENEKKEPSFRFMKALATYYGVSLDWLGDIIEKRNQEATDVHEATGLNEDAIAILSSDRGIEETDGERHIIDHRYGETLLLRCLLNNLLPVDEGREVLRAVFDYLFYDINIKNGIIEFMLTKKIENVTLFDIKKANTEDLREIELTKLTLKLREFRKVLENEKVQVI